MHLDMTEIQNSRNRPVLIDKNDEPITMGSARERGFQSIELFKSKVYINASQVEDRLQSKLHHLTLGFRLWRHVAKGGYSDKQKYEEDNLFKVFLTFAPVCVLEDLNVQR